MFTSKNSDSIEAVRRWKDRDARFFQIYITRDSFSPSLSLRMEVNLLLPSCGTGHLLFSKTIPITFMNYMYVDTRS